MWVREAEIRYVGKARRIKQVSSPESVWEFFSFLNDCVEERFCILVLNNKNAVIHWQEVSRGTISESIVHPREVFRSAIMVGGASIIVVHNHPSGVLQSSKEDIEATQRLKEVGRVVGIQLLDHLIISPEGYLSMKEQGYI